MPWGDQAFVDAPSDSKCPESPLNTGSSSGWRVTPGPATRGTYRSTWGKSNNDAANKPHCGEEPRTKLGTCMILELTQGLRVPLTVSCDNLLTLLEMALRLHCRGLALLGAVHASRPELPCKFLSLQTPLLFSRFAFVEPRVTLVSYPTRDADHEHAPPRSRGRRNEDDKQTPHCT